VTIDSRGKWWKGTSTPTSKRTFANSSLAAYSVDRVIQATCACGGTAFAINVDGEPQHHWLARQMRGVRWRVLATECSGLVPGSA
jgi:hypothetical protein